MRAEDDVESPAPKSPTVKRADVIAAVEVLGLQQDMREYWVKWAERHEAEWDYSFQGGQGGVEEVTLPVRREVAVQCLQLGSEGEEDGGVLELVLMGREEAEVRRKSEEEADEEDESMREEGDSDDELQDDSGDERHELQIEGADQEKSRAANQRFLDRLEGVVEKIKIEDDASSSSSSSSEQEESEEDSDDGGDESEEDERKDDGSESPPRRIKNEVVEIEPDEEEDDLYN
jgi:hypothetical protein